MRKTFTALALLPFLAFGQSQVSDDFSDGDFTSDPSWVGDTSFFEVNSAFELQLQDSVAGTRYLSTASGVVQNAVWEFYLRMEFNPSGSNYAKIYLVSDQSDLNGPLNGYFVRVGGSSEDRISLFRQEGSAEQLVLESTEDWVDLSTVEVRVQVQRQDDLWSLAADTSGGNDFNTIGSGTDSTFFFSTHFGVAPHYTVTRSDRFYFDDISITGEAFEDTIPPELERVEMEDSVTLLLTFSESVDTAAAENINHYELSNGMGHPATAALNPMDGRVVKLVFEEQFQKRLVYTLSVNHVEDRFGNRGSAVGEFVRYQPVEGDVVINELMIDPTPVIGIPPNSLPEREYIELYNRTELPINLQEWVLKMGRSVELLPDYTLAPHGFVVITKDEGAGEFPAGLPILPLDMSSVALTNGGTSVSLSDSSGLCPVSVVTYSDSWYGDLNKDDGGWSLEQIDPDNLCGGAQNWAASVDRIGGTPGAKNSVLGTNPDTIAPVFERVAIVGDSSVMLYFSERVEIGLLEDMENYHIQPQLPLLEATPQPPSYNHVLLEFGEPIDPERVYSVTLREFPADCSGNIAERDSFIFTIPAVPEEGDLLINEVLFNPPPGGADFVELYNYSDKVFDLSKIRLANWDAALDAPVNLNELREESFLIEPGRYLALTTDPAFVEKEYVAKNPENLVEVMALPSLPDSEGSIAITTSALDVIDVFQYSDKVHMAVLDDAEGISLERVSFDAETQDSDNWYSAAATAGFATPGYKNSQFFAPVSSAEVALEPKVFSPNQDGHNDLLKILYHFEDLNNVVNLGVWNSAGQQVRALQTGVSVGAEGFFTWDGTDENGQLLNSGIYIVVLDYFNAGGAREVVRKTCVLSL